jgi:dihydroorotase-like cyclic amidohydrolase
MAHAAGAPIHICHVSAAQTADVIANAKARNIDITAEVPPHFLLLDESEFARQGARVKTTPPLRSKQDNDALWMALVEGVIDALACDHFLGRLDPVPLDVLQMESAGAGIASLELSLPLLFSTGFKTGRMSLQRFVQVTSGKPAQIGGLQHRKGDLVPGYDADLVIWDPEGEWKISSHGEFSRNDLSPYRDWEIKGRISQTFVRGQPVWNGTNIIAPDGWGIHQPTNQ